jgi:hypothetical protein
MQWLSWIFTAYLWLWHYNIFGKLSDLIAEAVSWRSGSFSVGRCCAASQSMGS